MNRIYSATIALLLLLATSCTHKTTPASATGDYLIAGSAGGFVNLQHRTYYRIANGRVSEDTSIPYSAPVTDVSQFNFSIILPASKYDSVKNVLSSIPAELFGMNNQHIGKLFPDAGYLDVWSSVGGVSYHWYFEADQSGSSAAIQQFLKSLGPLLD